MNEWNGIVKKKEEHSASKNVENVQFKVRWYTWLLFSLSTIYFFLYYFLCIIFLFYYCTNDGI